jgi:hypothetical protein
MRVRPTGPYRRRAGAVLTGLIVATSLGASSAQALAVPRVPDPVPVLEQTPDAQPGAVTPAVTRIAVGSFAAPAPGVVTTDGDRTKTLSLVRASTARFSAVGVTWAEEADLGTITVAVRGHVPGGDWSAWQVVGTAEQDADDAGDPGGALRGGSDLVWLGTSDGIEVTLTVLNRRSLNRRSAEKTRPTDIAVDLIDPQDVPGDTAAGEPLAGDPLPPGSSAVAPLGSRTPGANAAPGAGRVPMPVIVRRPSWGAPEQQPNFRPTYAKQLKAIAWHHTATSNTYSPSDVPKILRSIYHYQTRSRGWSDIGYHVLVDRFGRLWEGRSGGLTRPVVGAHTGGFNTGTAGIAVIGDHRGVPVPAAAVDSASRYIAWRFSLGPAVDPRGSVSLTGGGSTSRFSPGTTITVPRVYPHRQTSPTECPGARGMEALTPLRLQAAAHLGAWGLAETIRARLATWRPSDGKVRIYGSADVAFTGQPGDVPVPADYDGDAITDVGVWNPTTGTWKILLSSDSAVREIQWGVPGDRPVPADFNGDGKAELTVFRPASGTWFIYGMGQVPYGMAGDVPLPADYDGDGRADLAVWRPSNGIWYMNQVGTFRLGESWHIPVPADYDGDGTVDPASWSPVSFKWFVRGRAPVRFGDQGDTPVPAHYDGDGRLDLAVLHIHSGGQGSWRIQGIGSYETGAAGDVPLALR